MWKSSAFAKQGAVLGTAAMLIIGANTAQAAHDGDSNPTEVISIAPGETSIIDLEPGQNLTREAELVFYDAEPAPDCVTMRTEKGRWGGTRILVKNDCAPGTSPKRVKVERVAITSPVIGSPDTSCQSVPQGEERDFDDGNSLTTRPNGLYLCE